MESVNTGGGAPPTLATWPTEKRRNYGKPTDQDKPLLRSFILYLT